MRSKICILVGRRIRTLRRDRGLTQEALASRAGMARESLSIVERGRRDIGVAALDRIIRALDVSWPEFFE